MRIKSGHVVEFNVLLWHEPQWEFDHPTVILAPVVAYSPNGKSAEKMIEDICIDLCVEADLENGKDIEDEDVSVEFNWRGWDVKRMNKVFANRMAGKEDWKSKSAKAYKAVVKFETIDDEICFTYLEFIEH
jgi:hypothetical protein